MSAPQPPVWYSPPPVIHLPITHTSYPMFWRTPASTWWQGVLTMVVSLLAFVMIPVFLMLPLLAFDPTIVDQGANLKMTPGLFLVNNLGLAALIPACMLLAWAFMGQRPGYMSSVLGRLRWRWMMRCVLVTAPVLGLWTAGNLWLSWGQGELKVYPHTVSMLVIVVTTQAFQAAGEEYLFRGVLFRGIASLFPIEWLGVALGTLIPTVLFMLTHGAGDIWLNVSYVVFAGCAAWLTWRTGGLEAAIAVHVVNNVVALSIGAFQPLANLMNREAGVGSPWMLLDNAVLIAITVLLTWLAKRQGVQSHNDPGAMHVGIVPSGIEAVADGLPPMQPQQWWGGPQQQGQYGQVVLPSTDPGYQTPSPQPYDGAP